MFRHALLKLMIPAALLAGAQSAFAENRLALVIGQSAYRAVPALPNPVNDARAVTQLLTDSGFEVSTASDLSQTQMRQTVSEFAGKVAAKGADTVALVFYAGHGLQIDGENFLVPIDIDPKREADIPIQAVRLNDILNTLNSVPSRMRILMLDACRNNPFPEISKTAGGGLAIVDAKVGAPGTFLSFSTSPGAVAEDGSGANSPYTTALLAAGKERGIPIEETFKRVRLAVNKVTEGRQTPWDSSSLVEDFRFSGASVPGPKPAVVKKTVAEWTRDLRGNPVEAANELIVADGTDEAYEAFAGLYAQTQLGKLARDWLDRHIRMVAWNNAVILNTAAGYRAFLARFPNSDLTATARKLEERLRNRPDFAPPVVAGAGAVPQNVALAAPTCPCNGQPSPSPVKRVNTPTKRVEPEPPKRVDRKPPRRPPPDDDVVIVRRPPPPVYEPAGPPVSIGIGIGIGGFGGGQRGGGNDGGGYGRRAY
ncbi:caspase family protein [Bradyrhizobium sp.]|uniref:caspase family protein n=1 Tax=Bradyrhizobium sp. TaxID=376 RepID=UPI0025BC3DCD|nr:caspase family protein [Bradyrhizobium sp.]